MKNIVLYVRHAESESNAIIHESRKNDRKRLTDSQEDKVNSYNDPDITSLGIRQSMVTGIHLISKLKLMKKKKINIWMSPFQRAQDTAKHFIDRCDEENDLEVRISIIRELQEYTSPKKEITEEQKESGIIIHETFQRNFAKRSTQFKRHHRLRQFQPRFK